MSSNPTPDPPSTRPDPDPPQSAIDEDPTGWTDAELSDMSDVWDTPDENWAD